MSMFNILLHQYFIPIMIATAPLTIWLLFFLARDKKEPEPIHWIIITLTFGAIAAFLTIIVEFIVTKDLVSITPLIAQSLEKRNLMGFIIVSTIEEIMKFLVVYILLHINKFFNEAIDAMIYMVIAAIGFSMVENALAIFGQLKISLSLTFPIQIIIARFLGANLLHIICSGIIGFFWAKTFTSKKHWYLGIGFILAIIIHTIFNYSLYAGGFILFPFILFFIFICATILLWMFDVVEELHTHIS